MDFPEDIAFYLPHRPPLSFLRTLIDCTGAEVITETVFEPESIAVGEGRVVENAALLELVAQSYAALRGHDDRKKGRTTSNGYLVGVTQFTAHARAYANNTLRTIVRTTGVYDEFFVGEGHVHRESEVLAEATIKVWMQTP